jgi:hypothetical protein
LTRLKELYFGLQGFPRSARRVAASNMAENLHQTTAFRVHAATQQSRRYSRLQAPQPTPSSKPATFSRVFSYVVVLLVSGSPALN